MNFLPALAEANMGQIQLGDKPPLIVGPEDTVAQAARAMTARHVGAAIVLKGESVIGVISERDVMEKLVAAGRDPEGTRVREIMSSPVLSVGVDTSVATAAKVMREHHIRHLVVLDEDQKLVGMLALRYVLYDLLDDMERSVGDLMGFIMIDGPGG